MKSVELSGWTADMKKKHLFLWIHISLQVAMYSFLDIIQILGYRLLKWQIWMWVGGQYVCSVKFFNF